uniref:Putative group i salivary lipocalin n=1 Tax=Rhipicephalus microplus TaxID=6941 RepID=A0A6G5A6A1_RHIMP
MTVLLLPRMPRSVLISNFSAFTCGSGSRTFGSGSGVYTTMFVNTKERLWTYKISRSGRIRCQNNLMRFITPEHIVYNRTFVYNGGRQSIVLQGQFSARHKNWMDVSTTDLEPRFLCRETLIFMANNTSCGVVKLEPVQNGNVYYELRVKNAYVSTVPDRRCGRHFSRVGGAGIFTYSPDCQDLIRPRE